MALTLTELQLLPSKDTLRMNDDSDPLSSDSVTLSMGASATTSSTDTSSLEDDIWNLDIDDILDNANCPVGKFGMRSNSLSSIRVPRSGSFKTRRSPPGRSVSFGKVEIRSFERVLGDNPPACGKGPSMALGWNYNEEMPVELDKFETKRRSSWTTSRRRNSKELIMSPGQRERLAKKFGFSEKEINSNAHKVEKVLKQRRKTQALDDAIDMVAIIQKVRRLRGFK